VLVEELSPPPFNVPSPLPRSSKGFNDIAFLFFSSPARELLLVKKDRYSSSLSEENYLPPFFLEKNTFSF